MQVSDVGKNYAEDVVHRVLDVLTITKLCNISDLYTYHLFRLNRTANTL